MKKAYINGEFVDSKDAKISIFDRGLLFGDGVYEVLPVYHGQPFFIDRHIARLHASLEACKIPMPDLDWEKLCHELIRLNDGSDLQIYIQVTRGNQNARSHDIPAKLTPTVMAFTLHLPFPKQEEKEKGLKASLEEDYRWLKCHIKSTSLLANILLNDQATSEQANTAILLRDGYLTEGSTANVFIVDKNHVVRTPPLNNLCLPGITRQITIELLNKLDIKVKEDAKISRDDIMTAQQVWITSTTKEIYPVSVVDKQKIGSGQVSALWLEVNDLYQQLVAKNDV